MRSNYDEWTHLIGEAVLVDPVHMRGEGVLAIGLPLTLVDHLAVGTLDPHVDVEEAALRHLEHEAHLGPHLHLVEEALLGVRVHL